MTNTNKTTYVSALSYVLTNCDLPADIAEKLEQLKAQTEKRNSGERKPTKIQSENVALKEQIVAYLSDNPHQRAMDIAHALDLSSGQKAAALLNQLVASEQVTVSEEKRVKYFSVA